MIKRYQSSANFISIVICFFLPFIDVRCNDVPLKQLNGFQLATGTTIKVGNDETLPKDESKAFDLNRREQHVDRNYFAFVALVLAIAALMLSLLLPKAPEIFMGLIGFSGLLCLLLMRIKLNHSIENEEGSYGQYNISINYLYGYWLALVLFAFAGATNLLRYIDKRQEELRTSDKHLNISDRH